jgi:hypothetical protein
LNAEVAWCTVDAIGNHSRAGNASIGCNIIAEDTAHTGGHLWQVLAGQAKTEFQHWPIRPELAGVAVLAGLVGVYVVRPCAHEADTASVAVDAVGQVQAAQRAGVFDVEEGEAVAALAEGEVDAADAVGNGVVAGHALGELPWQVEQVGAEAGGAVEVVLEGGVVGDVGAEWAAANIVVAGVALTVVAEDVVVDALEAGERAIFAVGDEVGAGTATLVVVDGVPRDTSRAGGGRGAGRAELKRGVALVAGKVEPKVESSQAGRAGKRAIEPSAGEAVI